ncbi:uncharacterized protein LOC111406565 [Olea europaea var. sylvestris]|uniref:uncharacterized protein LOC111406565 n=1 Tax=Olea europaea var. sylvestris TaxID=158386 RepID=UPI000C1D7D38|nr:uncharacterized protein LOC111406565 [Olea europaea var. sylvestris]
MPSYAKFLKDILSNKRKLGDHETVMLIEEYSTRIQKKVPPKLKYPGSFTVPCTISEKLGLGKAKTTTVTLQLADRALIDVQNKQLILRLGEEQISFNVFKIMKLPTETDRCFQIDVIDKVVQDSFFLHNRSDTYEGCIVHSQSTQSDSVEMETCAKFLDTNPPYTRKRYFEELGTEPTKPLPSIQHLRKLELKQLPPHLRYAYLGKSCTLHVIISNIVSKVEEEKLLRVLRENKTAIGWIIVDIKGISPSLYMHKILMEENFRPTIESQRRLNPNMKKAVRAECSNKERSLFSSVYRPNAGKISKPLTLLTHRRYSSYNQVLVAPDDQEKMIFTCPYGTFAYRRMPFHLYNAPATFQRCMMAIFSDIVEKFIEIFMDDFSVFGSSSDECLEHLNLVLQRCRETNLVLN